MKEFLYLGMLMGIIPWGIILKPKVGLSVQVIGLVLLLVYLAYK